MHRRISIMLLFAFVPLLAGCSLFGRQAGESADVEKLAATPYPKDAPLGEDIDIIVVRDGGALRLVNRTPHSYGDLDLWLNQQWLGKVDRIVIGGDNFVQLPSFVNHHRERFPVGGFLTPDKTLPVVLAELYDPATGQRHRLNARVISNDAVIADLTGDSDS